MECYLWTPSHKKFRFGKLYVSQNFACFASHVAGQVGLVIPLRDVASVERCEAVNGSEVDDAVAFHTRTSGRSANNTFVFAQLPDRDFVLEKFAELLAGLKEPVPVSIPEEAESAEAGTLFTEPLMTLFAEDHTMDRSLEATKEILWEKHFSDFGRGVSMFRTEEATRLVVKGIPDR